MWFGYLLDVVWQNILLILILWLCWQGWLRVDLNKGFVIDNNIVFPVVECFVVVVFAADQYFAPPVVDMIDISVSVFDGQWY